MALKFVQFLLYRKLTLLSVLCSYMRREDSGMFQCSGYNEGGYVTGYTWLRVKSKHFYIQFLKRLNMKISIEYFHDHSL